MHDSPAGASQLTPYELFFPTDFSALTGMVDPERLAQAAELFPGGVVGLVFMLFWAPIGPGIPAGVLLAVHAKLPPLLTFSLYTLSDTLGACICHPLYQVLRRWGGRVPALRALGQRLMKLALIGTRPPRAEDLASGRGTLPALFRIGTIGFGADVYTAGMLVAGLPVPRLAGWGAAIVGDLIWFAMLLVTTLATAQVTDRSWVQLVVMVVVMFVVPRIARRIFPALRDPEPAA
jgi:hypothetical protein